MKIIGLEANNVRKIKAITMKNLGDGVIEIAGKNENGKTSVLRSIEMAIGGQKYSGDKPIREGAKKAEIILETDKYKITRAITKTGQQLKVEDMDGKEQAKPQSLLDSFLSDFTFDPLSFARMKDAEQTKALTGIVKVDFDYDNFEKEFGIKLDRTKNVFSAISVAEKQVYDERTIANRKEKEAETYFKSIEVAPQLMDTKPISVAELREERQKLEAIEASNKRETDNLLALKAQLDSAKQEYDALRARLDELKASGTKLKAEVEAQSKKVEALVPVDFSSIDKKEQSADETNAIARKAEEKRKAKEAYNKAQAAAKELDDKVAQIRSIREETIRKANFPVPGLAIDENDTITLEGIPLSERGTSKQILVGLEVCAAMNPELKVILIRDANNLDADNMKVMADWASQKQYQIWIERVANEPNSNSFFIEDGEFVSTPKEE